MVHLLTNIENWSLEHCIKKNLTCNFSQRLIIQKFLHLII